MSLMVSISGIRGVVGETLTPDVIIKYAAAFSHYCNNGKIVIGWDGRSTGKMITNLVSSTLISMGSDVIAIGIVPTPTIALAVEKLGAAGGIAVTASHNPMQWNGLKFISSTGMFLDNEENRKFWEIADDGNFTFARWDKLGKHIADNSFIQKHIESVLNLPGIKVEEIKKRKFKVVVDCINSAGGIIVPQMLRLLECSVVEMNCEVSGIFSRTPEPVPENLGAVCKRVKEENADLGIVVDPDVDRLVFIDERGEPIGEEYTITSVVKFILENRISNRQVTSKSTHSKSVVVNLSTTRAVDDVAKTFGATVFRTPVGEINVAKKMKEVHAVVGGEGSGGVILPDVHYGRDAIVGVALMLQQLAQFRNSLSEFKKSLPAYIITKSKVEIQDKNPDILLEKVKRQNRSKGTINEDDGLKIDFPDSWVHLRKSNTEPIIRIIAEAPTAAKAQNLVNEFKQQLSN